MKRVLIVDDEPDLLESLSMALDMTFEVRTAVNGQLALEILLTEPVDVMVLDLMMPVLSGEELACELARRGLHVPTVVVSAGRELAATCQPLGIQHYLQKPYRLPALIAKLDAAMAEARPPGTPSGPGEGSATLDDEPAGAAAAGAAAREG